MEKDYYVLHFNTWTTEYMNEIEFMTKQDAIKKFENEKPYNIFDRIELIYSPQDKNKDNEVVLSKKYTKKEKKNGK